MITLKQLHDSISDLIKDNPKAANYNVINFDYLHQRSVAAELVTQHHYLVSKDNKELIFDSADEMFADGTDDTYKISKVILL